MRGVRKSYGWRREGPRNKETANRKRKHRNNQEGDRQRGEGREPKKTTRSQNLFAADFLTIVDLADINGSRRQLGLREETIGYN